MSNNELSTERLTDSRFGWYQVGVAFVTTGTISGVSVYAYSLLIVLIAADIEVSAFQQMWPKTAMMAGGAAFAAMVGLLVERYSVRRFLILGVLALAIGLALVSRAESIIEISIIFCLALGAAQGLLGPQTSLTLVSRWIYRNRTIAMGLTAVGVSVGGFIAPLAVNVLTSYLHWRELFVLLGGACLVIMLPPVLLLVREKPDDFQEVMARERSGAERSAQSVSMSVSEIFLSPSFWALSLAVGTVFAVSLSIISNLVQIASEKGISTADAASVLASMAIFGVVGKISAGFMGDRFRKSFLLLMVCIFIASGLVFLASASSFAVLTIVCLFISFSSGASLPLSQALTAELFGVTNFAKVMGLKHVIMFVLMTVGPPIAGLAHDFFGSYDPAIYLFSSLSAVAGVLIAYLYLIRERSISRQ